MNLGFSEMLFLSLLGLLLFGPRRLPEIGRQMGHFLAEFKRASNALHAQIEAEVRQLDSAPAAAVSTLLPEPLISAIEPPQTEAVPEGAASV